MIFNILLLFLSLPCLIYSSDKIIAATPKVTPINESFVHIDLPIKKDFSQEYKIESINTSATVISSQRKSSKLRLLVSMDTCKSYSNLILRINQNFNSEDLFTFDYVPGQEDKSYSWICYENSSIFLSLNKSEDFDIRHCINQVEVQDSGNNFILLQDGKNENISLPDGEDKEVILKIRYDDKPEYRIVHLSSCSETDTKPEITIVTKFLVLLITTFMNFKFTIEGHTHQMPQWIFGALVAYVSLIVVIILHFKLYEIKGVDKQKQARKQQKK